MEDKLTAALACMEAMSERIQMLEGQKAAYERPTGCDMNVIAQLEALEHRLKNARYIIESAERATFEAREREEEACKEAQNFAIEARRLARQLDCQRRREMLKQLEIGRNDRELLLTDAMCKLSCLKSDPEIALPIGVTKRRNLRKLEQQIHLLEEEQKSVVHMLSSLQNAEKKDDALRTAAAAGNFEIMQSLLDQGARVDAPDEQGASAFDYSCGLGNIHGVKICLQAGADPLGGSLGIGPLAMVGATRYNLLQKKNAKSEIEALACAASRPLVLAAERGHLDVCKLLLDNAIIRSKLLEATDAMGRTPLHAAASRAHITTARLLLHYGALLNATDAALSTPLHAAAANKNSDPDLVVKMIQFLLASGADPSKRNASKQTAYQVALKVGRLPIVRAFPPRAATTPSSSQDDHTCCSDSQSHLTMTTKAGSSSALLRPSWDATPIAATLEEQRDFLLNKKKVCSSSYVSNLPP